MFAALRSLVARDAPPYDVGEGVKFDDMWMLASGTAKADSAIVSVFSHDKRASSEDKIACARNTVKRLRGLRHPSIVKFIDTFETDTHVHLVTEPVKPLARCENPADPKQLFAVLWGLLHVLKVVSFLNDSHLAHRHLRLGAVLVDRAGEWKLGAVDCMGGDKDPVVAPRQDKYLPPEKENAATLPWATDMWGLGCLVWEVFNGVLPRPAQLTQTGAIPKALLPHYVQLVSASPKSRPNPSVLLNDMRAPGKCLNTPAIEACLFLETLAAADKDEATACYQRLPQLIDGLPDEFCRYKLLPVLLSAFNFQSAGSGVLTPLLKIGKFLEPAEYTAQIVPCLVRLFSSPDRATRISLLQQLDQFISYLSADVITNDIFPHVVHGFSDTVPAVREQTVKAMLLVVPRLHAAAVDTVLRHFAKLQVDEQPSIRTNTTICLGKLAKSLPSAARDRVLIPAFLRATKDPFTHARAAGVMAVGATIELFTAMDCATRIFPALTPLCVDAELSVRDQTFAVCRALMARLEAASKGEDAPPPTDDRKDQAAAAGTATWATWAGSAIGAMSFKLLKGANADGAVASSTDAPPTPTTPAVPAAAAATSGSSSSTHAPTATAATNKASSGATGKGGMTVSPPKSKAPPSDEDEDNGGDVDDDVDDEDGWNDDSWDAKPIKVSTSSSASAAAIRQHPPAPTLASASTSLTASPVVAGDARDLKAAGGAASAAGAGSGATAGAAKPARLGAMRLGEPKRAASVPAASLGIAAATAAATPSPVPTSVSTVTPGASSKSSAITKAAVAEADGGDGWDVGDWSADFSPPKTAAAAAGARSAPASAPTVSAKSAIAPPQAPAPAAAPPSAPAAAPASAPAAAPRGGGGWGDTDWDDPPPPKATTKAPSAQATSQASSSAAPALSSPERPKKKEDPPAVISSTATPDDGWGWDDAPAPSSTAAARAASRRQRSQDSSSSEPKPAKPRGLGAVRKAAD